VYVGFVVVCVDYIEYVELYIGGGEGN